MELSRRGLAVGLATRGGEVAPAFGPRHLARLLGRLAFIAPEAGDGPPRARRGVVARVRPGADIDLPAHVWPGALGTEARGAR